MCARCRTEGSTCRYSLQKQMGRPRKKAREGEEKDGSGVTSSPDATESSVTNVADRSPAPSGTDVVGDGVVQNRNALWEGDLTNELLAFQKTIGSIVSDTAAAVFIDELGWLNRFKLLLFVFIFTILTFRI